MADFVFKISPNIILGSYVTARLGQLVLDWGNRFMLIMDPVLREVGIAEKIENTLKSRNIDYFLYDDIPESPDTQFVENALSLARNAHINGVIAAGGTKTANIARAVCSLFNDSVYLYDCFDGNAPTAQPLPFICLPTTNRDAFLFTDRVPLIDARSRQIRMLKTQSGLCKLVVLDPNNIITLTSNQRSSITLESLCIAVEAYISQRSNFFSDTVIEKAVELLTYSQDGSTSLTITTPPEVLFTQGACMASLGSALSSPGAATLLSMAIYARYKISRSLTTSILFPYILADASTYKADKLSRLAKIIAGDGNTNLSENIRNRIAAANLPARLKDLSISLDQLALAAEDAGQLEYMNGLSRSMTADDLFELIKQAY